MRQGFFRRQTLVSLGTSVATAVLAPQIVKNAKTAFCHF